MKKKINSNIFNPENEKNPMSYTVLTSNSSTYISFCDSMAVTTTLLYLQTIQENIDSLLI